jgi:hypothetical protein
VISSLVLADGGPSRLVEIVGGLLWMFGAGVLLVGILVVVVVGLRRLLGFE